MIRLIPGDRVYLDTNAFIRAHEHADPGARELFAQIQSGRFVGVSSDLTFAELLVKPLRLHRVDLIGRYEELFDVAGPLTIVAIDRGMLRKGAGVQARVGGRLPDAVHVACAVEAGCRCLLTKDGKLRTVPAMPVLLLADLPGAL